MASNAQHQLEKTAVKTAESLGQHQGHQQDTQPGNQDMNSLPEIEFAHPKKERKGQAKRLELAILNTCRILILGIILKAQLWV